MHQCLLMKTMFETIWSNSLASQREHDTNLSTQHGYSFKTIHSKRQQHTMVHAQKKEQTHKKSLKMKKKVKMNSVNLCTNALFCNRGTWEIVHTIINYEFIQTMAKKKREEMREGAAETTDDLCGGYSSLTCMRLNREVLLE